MNESNANAPLTFRKESEIPVSAEQLYRWHERPGAFARLTPPWKRVDVIEHNGVVEGQRTLLRMRVAGLPLPWVAEHRDVLPGRSFRDVQIKGPFRRWSHLHEMTPIGERCCRLRDLIEIEPPFGALGRLARRPLFAELESVFGFRHRTTLEDLALHARTAGARPLTVAVSGASGLLGRTLVPLLTTGGHRVLRLVRRPVRSEDEVEWNHADGVIDRHRLEGIDALVHLAGESIAERRWSADQKARIRLSRVGGTTAIVRSLQLLERPPSALLCASAVGFYGDAGDQPLEETAARGDGFLAEVCAAWEDAARGAESAGMRVANLRFGVILTPAGGALQRMLTPFRTGLGGIVGSGEQVVSWVSIDDAAAAVLHTLATPGLSGPVNIAAPAPVTNRQLTKVLGAVLSRPTVLPMPASLARLAFGELADELLLTGCRALPKRLLQTGFRFRHAQLPIALGQLLGRATPETSAATPAAAAAAGD